MNHDDQSETDKKALAALAELCSGRELLQLDEAFAEMCGGSGNGHAVSGEEVRRRQHRFASVQRRLAEAMRELRQDLDDQPAEVRARSELLHELNSHMLSLSARADLLSWPTQGWTNLDDESFEWLTYFDNYLASIDNAITKYEEVVAGHKRKRRQPPAEQAD